MENIVTPTVIELQAALGADHWRKVFNVSELTLLPGSFERVNQALRHPNSNADRIAQAMALDPALCLHFFLRANALVQRTGNEVHSLTHLISLLGVNSIGQILKSLPVANRPLPFYWRQLQISLLRRNFLLGLPLSMSGIDATQLTFPVLFSDCSHWLRWHFAARQQNQLEGLSRNPKIGAIKAKQLVFGCDIDNVLQGILTQKSLPHDLKESLKQTPFELKGLLKNLLKAQKGKAFQGPMHKRQTLIVLLNRLTACFCQAPNDRATRRYQHLLAQLLQVNEASIGQALHYAAAQLPTIHDSLIDTHPARRLLCHWPKNCDAVTYALPRPQQASKISTPIAQTTPTSATQSHPVAGAALSPNRLLDNRFLDAPLVRQLLLALTKGHPELNSLNSLFQAVGQTLQKGMGMEFAAILVPTTDNQWVVKVQFDSQGSSMANSLANQGLLAKLGTKAAAVLITSDNRSALTGQLPQELETQLNNREVLLMSVFLNTRPVALLIAAETDLTPPRVQACKRLTQATQQAIARLALQVQRQTKHP